MKLHPLLSVPVSVLLLGVSLSPVVRGQAADRAQLRAWQGRYPHHKVKGPRGRMQETSFFKLPSVRKPLADLLGPALLEAVEAGDYLEEKIELVGDHLVLRLIPNPHRIDDERRLIIVVPLTNNDLYAVYYREDVGADGRRNVQTEWKHGPGKSPDDLPKSLQTTLATMMGLP